MGVIGSGAPFLYDHANIVNSSVNPSDVHVSGTGLNRFFERYLMQKAISVFKWKMPENWDKDYFLYCLYTWGFLAIFDSKKFGVIPQGCGLRGYNVFYRPTHAIITNPLITGATELAIDKDCILVKLMLDYGGIYDLVSFYANMLALCAESCGVNLLNSKLAYVFAAKSKSFAESFKKMFDSISSGEPAVVVDKSLFNDDGTPNWETFAQNLKENYIASDIISDMRKIEAEFDTRIGIPNANTDKRERLITDEVNANNSETASLCSLWLENLQASCRKAENMFGISLSVDWREDLKPEVINNAV